VKLVAKFAAGVVDTGGKFASGVVDTGGQPWAANISANFRKNSNRPQWYTQGRGGNWFMKKTRSKKSRDTVPLSHYRYTINWKLERASKRSMSRIRLAISWLALWLVCLSSNPRGNRTVRDGGSCGCYLAYHIPACNSILTCTVLYCRFVWQWLLSCELRPTPAFAFALKSPSSFKSCMDGMQGQYSRVPMSSLWYREKCLSATVVVHK
jgi:hypothetical protein